MRLTKSFLDLFDARDPSKCADGIARNGEPRKIEVSGCEPGKSGGGVGDVWCWSTAACVHTRSEQNPGPLMVGRTWHQQESQVNTRRQQNDGDIKASRGWEREERLGESGSLNKKRAWPPTTDYNGRTAIILQYFNANIDAGNIVLLILCLTTWGLRKRKNKIVVRFNCGMQMQSEYRMCTAGPLPLVACQNAVRHPG